MKPPSRFDASFSDAVRLFVTRHVDLSRTLVRLREETGDDPPGLASPQELLRDLIHQFGEVERPTKVSVARFAVRCSSPLDVAGDTYRSAFHAVVDIAKRLIWARHNDFLAPLAISVADLRSSKEGAMNWNELRESILHQSEVSRIARRLKFASERVDEELGPPENEPGPSERETDRWLDRLSLLGRSKPNKGAKAMWRRLSLISHQKRRTKFSYGESFGRVNLSGEWNGADHRARKRLKSTQIHEKPILDEGGGHHILRCRLPMWFLKQLERDHPLVGT